jgi:hypothetical protein
VEPVSSPLQSIAGKAQGDLGWASSRVSLPAAEFEKNTRGLLPVHSTLSAEFCDPFSPVIPVETVYAAEDPIAEGDNAL